MQREIPRFIECPPLSPELTGLLTELVYLPNDIPRSCDLLFVFGNRNFSDAAKHLDSLLHKHLAPKVIITGGIPKFEDSYPYEIPESEEIFNRIPASRYPDVYFALEKSSISTVDNVRKSLGLIPENLQILGFTCLWYISRRSRLSLQKYLPQTRLLQFAYPKIIPEENAVLDPENWIRSDTGKNRTYAEYLRIKLYGERGDIAYDSSTQELVSRIDALV